MKQLNIIVCLSDCKVTVHRSRSKAKVKGHAFLGSQHVISAQDPTSL